MSTAEKFSLRRSLQRGDTRHALSVSTRNLVEVDMDGTTISKRKIAAMLDLGTEFLPEERLMRSEKRSALRRELAERTIHPPKPRARETILQSDPKIGLQMLFKEVPTSWLSNLETKEVEHVYEQTLKCVHYPLRSSPELLKAMSHFATQDYEILRKAFGISPEVHERIKERAISSNTFILNELNQRLKLAEEDRSTIFSRSSFQTKEEYETWKMREIGQIKRIITSLETAPSFEGSLYVNVLKARGVAVKDAKTSDPYCVVSLRKDDKDFSKQKFTTPVIRKTLDPYWNYECSIKLDEKYQKLGLRVRMWDEDKISKDDYMGEVNVSLTTLFNFDLQKRWFQLEKSKSKLKKSVSGDLKLILLLNVRNRLSKVLPPANQILPSEVENHRYYKELLFKLLQLENDFNSTEGLKALSVASTFLLDEYATRFGIGAFYRWLVHLEILVDKFALNRKYLEEVNKILRKISELKTGGTPFTKDEMELYDRVVMQGEKTSLNIQVENVISNFRLAFRKLKMDGSMKLLCEIHAKIHGREISLKRIENLVKKFCSKEYSILREGGGEELEEEKLSNICDLIIEKLEEDNSVFQPEFPRFRNSRRNDRRNFSKIEIDGKLKNCRKFGRSFKLK
eukprot:TRINITY_DN4358_c0_g1_i3.p1 TRINITY_DN4358_c0_g1~~TRINITY_DN4358_c0_g1_i3.p1  ORF type:complete len:626 (-),score=221.85 TRINITY_DN4358_c0_g1_i3:2048-3925(-)